MIHLPDQILDLALILISAGVVTLFFRWIKQPVVLGYILAGFLVSPHFGWFPTVADGESVKVWAEIGVIFLLFALGLEFSFKKLARVGGSASVTAAFEVVGMVGIGYLTGKILDWSSMDSLFLGGVLAISSTTIIIRAFEELGLKNRGFVSLVFGVLIVEDLFAILLLVLLSTLAVSQTFSGAEMGISILKLGFFLALWFVSGIFILPSFLKVTRPLMKEETMLVVSLGLCFLMVVLATKAGFSPALGAFIMGSILAETVEGHKIEKLIHPVKDLFAAVFFVSVGMMIEPAVLVQYAGPIALITFVTIVGKTLTTAFGSLLSGKSLRHSVQSGMSLAQIGEFSFIIAGLGLSLKVTSEFLYPVAIGVSAITTFTTPYFIRFADPSVAWLEKNLPQPWLEFLAKFSAQPAVSKNAEMKRFLNSYFLQMSLNLVIVVAISLSISRYVWPWIALELDSPLLSEAVSLILAMILSAPFLWALAFRRIKYDGSRGRNSLFAFAFARWIVALFLVLFIVAQFATAWTVLLTATLLAITVLAVLSSRLQKIYIWLEGRFVRNLNEREDLEKSKQMPALAPWDAHLTKLEVSAFSPLAGKKLSEAMIRERFGISVAAIQRGESMLAAPGRDEVIFPFDVLHVIGTDDQIAKMKAEVEVASDRAPATFGGEFGLRSYNVEADSPFANRTIRESGLREKMRGLVVGIEKSGQRILNPDSLTVIEVHDILWIVGDHSNFKF